LHVAGGHNAPRAENLHTSTIRIQPEVGAEAFSGAPIQILAMVPVRDAAGMEKQMADKRKFYKRVFKFEVLSETPLDGDYDLTELDALTDTGDCVGRFLDDDGNETLDGKAMAAALYEAGSEPGFFNLDDEGIDLDDDEGLDEEGEEDEEEADSVE
jgi:hypothetical protein